MKNEHYKKITGVDTHDIRRMNFTMAELKVIYNHFIDVLEDYPEMITYQDVCDKIRKKIDDDCNCEHFYGVNDITNMEMFYAESRDGDEIAVEMNIQSTLQKENEDVVFFFSPWQIDLIGEVNKKMKKKYKKK